MSTESTWPDRLSSALSKVTDAAVDVAAIAALGYIALNADPGVTAEVGSMIVTVAVGKRYMERRGESA